MSKSQILSLLLLLGAFYYFFGAVAHYFCITMFPWYDSSLCSPYHDSLIAVASLSVAGFFYVTALNPFSMKLNLWVIIVMGPVVSALTYYHAISFDFVSTYGSDAKVIQASLEGALLLFLAVLILYLRPIDELKDNS